MPDQAPETTPPTPASPAAPKEKTLVDEYDLGDVSFTAGGQPVPVASPAAPAATPAAAAASPAPALTQPAPEKPKHNKRTLAMARDFGLSEQEIMDATPDALDDAVYHLNRQAMAGARERSRVDALTGSAPAANPATPAASQQPAAAKPDDVKIEWGKFKDDSGVERDITDNDIAPGIVNFCKGLVKELNTVKAQLGHVTTHLGRQQAETMGDQIDRVFADLGQPALFGTGTRRDIKPDSAEAARRLAVLQAAERLRDQPGSLADKLKKAAVTIFGMAPPATPAAEPPARQPSPRDPVTQQFISPQDWDAAAVRQPSHREGRPEPKGEAKAVKTAARKLAEMNGEVDAETSIDGFLS